MTIPMQKATKRRSNKPDEESQTGEARRDRERGDAGERKRDEQRASGGPRYGGEPWTAADRRNPEERFGSARNDDAEPLELIRDQGKNDDDESPRAADVDVAVAEITRSLESGGAREGFGRGEKPRKIKGRTKKNPKPNTKTKKHRR